jgi:hypothetical protein
VDHHFLTNCALTVGPSAIGLAIVVACAGLVFLGRVLVRRRAAVSLMPADSSSAIEHPVGSGPVESRFTRSQRRAPVPILVSDVEVTVEPVTGWVINRNVEGLTLELEEEGQVDPGTVLSVRPKEGDVSLPWVQVEVTRGKAVKGGWHLACRYVKTPPYNIRMLFG